MTNGTTCSGADQSVMTGDVASNSSHSCALEAALGVGDSGNERQARSGGANGELEVHSYPFDWERNLKRPARIAMDKGPDAGFCRTLV